MRTVILLVSLIMLAASATAQGRLPVLDVHLHAIAADRQGPPPRPMCVPFARFPTLDPREPYRAEYMTSWIQAPEDVARRHCQAVVWSERTDQEVMLQTIDAMARRNVVGVLSGTPERVAAWMEAAPWRFIPALEFYLQTAITPDSLRRLVEAGAVAVFGEVENQYAGIAPDDERLAPYWALAEELDLPLGIHIGAGPPGAAAVRPHYLARLNSALTLEPVLVRHPRLRVYIIHAGWPLLDDLLAVLYTHPQVHVNVSYIVYALPRSEFYGYMRRIMEAGFSDRVMFGSDQMVWPALIERSIAIIEEAPFLSDEQKQAILYDNAARFLRLRQEEIARHHAR